jgi:hypothetical protein
MSNELSVSFRLTDASAVPVTGKTNGDFTCTVYRDGGASSDTVSVAELGDGFYKATGDASELDKYHVVVASNTATNLVNGQKGAASFDVYADALHDLNLVFLRGIQSRTFAVSIAVTDDADDPVVGASIAVQDETGSTTITQIATAGDGVAYTALFAGTYRFVPLAPGYVADDPGTFARTVSADGPLDAITVTALAFDAPADAGRCRVIHFVDDACAPSSALSGTATPADRPQFVDATDERYYTGLTEEPTALAKIADGLFAFDDLKRCANYTITIPAESIDHPNGVVAVPTDFTGGTDGIAYLVQGSDGRIEITVVPSA